jgi:hypothetical protein
MDGDGSLPVGILSIENAKASVDCTCVGHGKYEANVSIDFHLNILYNYEGEKDHENGHLEIMENYFYDRANYYSSKYEHTYNSYQECKAAVHGVIADLIQDYNVLNDIQRKHDDRLQNTINWVRGIFIKR